MLSEEIQKLSRTRDVDNYVFKTYKSLDPLYELYGADKS
jgi:hypothetical protein